MEQREDLYRIVVDAYNTRAELERLLYFKMGRHLTSIVPETADHDHTVFTVLKSAEQHGWLEQLVSAMAQARPEHQGLSHWARGHLPSAGEPGATSASVVMHLDFEELRHIVRGTADGAADPAFETAEIYADAAVLTASQHDGNRLLLRVEAKVLTELADRERFEEVVALASYATRSPWVAELVSSGFTTAGLPYVVQLIDRPISRPLDSLPLHRIVDLGAKLADVLAVAHSRAATFGGIDKSHIFLTPDGEPVLALPQLPMFAQAESTPATTQEDVNSLCRLLQSMIRNSAPDGAGMGGSSPELAKTQVLNILEDAAAGRLIAAGMRDRLERLRRDLAPVRSGPRVLTVLPRDASLLRRGESGVPVVQGDLFDEDADIVVGFSDTFDTATAGSVVISSSSLQGQLVRRLYQGALETLDADLDRALAAVDVESVETRQAKQQGKLRRYPIGTVAVLRRHGRWIYAVAFSRMGNDLTAESDPDYILRGLSGLWREVRRHSRGQVLAMPIVGSGLSRLDLPRERLAEIIESSYRSHAREEPIHCDLRIVVHPSDAVSFALPSAN